MTHGEQQPELPEVQQAGELADKQQQPPPPDQPEEQRDDKQAAKQQDKTTEHAGQTAAATRQPGDGRQQAQARRHSHKSNKQALNNDQQPAQQQVPISADYLAQLIKDKKQLSAFPSVFLHVQRLIDDEIHKVRQALFQLNDVVNASQPLELPEPVGEPVQLQEKIYVPVDEHPEYNFVGRLLGPRGMTAKQLEQEVGCKIMIRGRGSMRDKKKEEQNRGKANWEHLNDELHVLITVEDAQNRAELKLKRALEEVKQLLVPIVDGEDELKKRQLMELAIINGTYRDCNYNETLSKMLNEAVYQQSLTGESRSSGQASSAGAGGNQRVFPHYANLNGSSSGVPSTGSNTPNSIQGSSSSRPGKNGGQLTGQAHLHQHQHVPAMHLMQQAPAHLHRQPGPPQYQAGPSGPAPPPSLHLHPHQLHHPGHPGHAHPHQHPHHSPAAAAAAAAATAAALMGNPSDPGALMYHAQQYHEFQQYAAAMAAAAAADYHSAHLHAPPAALAQALAAAAVASNVYRPSLVPGEPVEHHQAAQLALYGQPVDPSQPADQASQSAERQAKLATSGQEVADQQAMQHNGNELHLEQFVSHHHQPQQHAEQQQQQQQPQPQQRDSRSPFQQHQPATANLCG